MPDNVRFLRHINHCYDWGTFGKRPSFACLHGLDTGRSSCGLQCTSYSDYHAGWVVRSKVITAGYKYFIMLNSSVRGPFIPPYLVSIMFGSSRDALSSYRCLLTLSCIVQGKVAWHRLFTQRLSSDVLLVGPTISCEGTPNRLNMSELRQNPHVQSYVIALNRVAMLCMVACCCFLASALTNDADVRAG